MPKNITIATGEEINGQHIVVVEGVKSFESVKKRIIDAAVAAGAHCSSLTRAKRSVNHEELLAVIKDEIFWCINNKVVTAESLECDFGTELLWKQYIYTSGQHSVELIDSATLVTLDSSSATVETLGSSSATVKTLDSSSATVKTWGSSSATVKTLGSSSATTSMGDGMCPTIKNLSEKKLYVKISDFEIIHVK